MPIKHYYGKSEDETHGDLSWINSRIGLLPIAIQREVEERYDYIFLKLKNDGEKRYRQRANLWLLRTTEKNKAVNDGGYF
tara:strand:- start:3342 stop:3581 length:240 start_codon:yes stop_codon:yes gene_type:complete